MPRIIAWKISAWAFGTTDDSDCQQATFSVFCLRQSACNNRSGFAQNDVRGCCSFTILLAGVVWNANWLLDITAAFSRRFSFALVELTRNHRFLQPCHKESESTWYATMPL